MTDASGSRLVFMANPEIRLIVVRPIGAMTGLEFITRLFDAYRGVEAPWTYNRLSDFRRYEGYIAQADMEDIARRWISLAAGHSYHARVAVLSNDHRDKLRVPAASPLFPNETICLLADFREAMAWLGGAELLKAPSEPSNSPRETGDIVVV